SLISPPRVLLKIKPRFTLVRTVWSTTMLRMPARFPSLNFTPADAEDSRQLVTLMFSQTKGGPQEFSETNTIQSSPVSMVQFEMETSLHPSRSMPSAQTASFKLV